jgi:hypothetical protein
LLLPLVFMALKFAFLLWRRNISYKHLKREVVM